MSPDKVRLIWRSTSWWNNLWSSAVLAVLGAIIVWAIVGIALGFNTADRLAKVYQWHLIGTLFALSLVLRRPATKS